MISTGGTVPVEPGALSRWSSLPARSRRKIRYMSNHRTRTLLNKKKEIVQMSHFFHRATTTVTLLSATLALAACGGGTQSFSSSAPLQENLGFRSALTPAVSEKPLYSLSGEHFTASDVQVSGKCPGSDARFSATGTTVGPYPGTFEATGNWYDKFSNEHGFQWYFKESFTIASGSNSIVGTISKFHPGHGAGPMDCLQFGRGELRYEVGSTVGHAIVAKIKNGYLAQRLY